MLQIICLLRILHPTYHKLRRIRKADKLYGDKLDFKYMKWPVKVRDIHKLKEKIPSTLISVFGYKGKEKYPIYVSKKCCEDKHVDLVLMCEGGKNYFLTKDFNTFMYDYAPHR